MKHTNSKEMWEFVHCLDSLAIKKQKEEIERLTAEVERLEGNIFGWKGVVMGQDSRLKCRDEEIELLKTDLERRTDQYNSIIDQHLDTISDLKSKVEHIDLYKSVVEKFFNSADLKNQPDAQSHYAIMEKLKQLPDCILDFTEEQVRDNPAWALAVFRHKVKDMQYKRVHDLNAIGGEQEENARLKAEVDRLRHLANQSEFYRTQLQKDTCRLENIQMQDAFKHYEAENASLKAEVERLNDLANDPYRLSKGWRPIETAPKDETTVLIYYQISDHVDNNGNTYVGRWYDDMEAGDPMFSVIGIGLLTPTHWMPLPNPPAAKDGTSDR